MPENVLRYVNTNTSIRTGKYGPYIYYKTEKMVKPAFYSLAKFNVKRSATLNATLNSTLSATLSAKDYLTCEPDILLDWLKDTYGRSFS
jgi:DNA topoisomerase-1